MERLKTFFKCNENVFKSARIKYICTIHIDGDEGVDLSGFENMIIASKNNHFESFDKNVLVNNVVQICGTK